MSEDEKLELEPASGFEPVEDRRPRMDEPLPVRLVAVADVRLPALRDLEPQHDAFYCGLLKMVRDEPRSQRIYRADNFRVVFELIDGPIERDTCRALSVEIDSLSELEHKLVDRGIAYERIKGLVPGVESLMFRDPSGNWVEVVEERRIA
jgi:hypothetical protein